jgi:hypothetical protein
MKAIQHLFADVTAKLEDVHAISVEGQRRDNAPDMQWVLVCHVRQAIAAIDAIACEIKQGLGDAHD